jgi:class 3 adenylate cyclase
VGSTALASSLDPEITRKIILRYQDRCAGVFARFEGFLARFMEDGILAYFGYPQAHEDEPERAVRAALELVRAVSQIETPDGARVSARVGVATGLVVVGDLIGEGAAQEKAVVGGDAPNLAAWLQAAAAPRQVLILEPTSQLLGASFELRSLGDYELSGILKPIPVYAVLEEQAADSRF